MENENGKPEFWEAAFSEKQEMWGLTPSNAALQAGDFFVERSAKNILIPGIGYGRNAQVFRNHGMTVTGIEISKTAIEMAQKHYGMGMVIHHGSVTDMPFDDLSYDGIFCHSLIHLLDAGEREKLVRDCYHQLSRNGYMIFSMISKAARTFGKGTLIGTDRYELFGGVKMFFYDRTSVHAEFERYGLFEVTEVFDDYPLFLVKCKKGV